MKAVGWREELVRALAPTEVNTVYGDLVKLSKVSQGSIYENIGIEVTVGVASLGGWELEPMDDLVVCRVRHLVLKDVRWRDEMGHGGARFR